MPLDDECCHNSPSADHQGEKLDGMYGSNMTVESPSVVLGKRKNNVKRDGTLLDESNHNGLKGLGMNYTRLTKDLENMNVCKSNSVSENKNEIEPERLCLDSINGSNKTDGGDGASKIIPWVLHQSIQQALEQREILKRNRIKRAEKKALKYNSDRSLKKDLEYKNDSESDLDNDKFEVEQSEASVRFYAKKLKRLKQLPRDWEYDPDTASTFVAAKVDISALQKIPPPHDSGRCCSLVYDPMKFPKTTLVPLNDDDRFIWLDFLNRYRDEPRLRCIAASKVDELKRPIEVEDPIVTQIGNFAVAAFNEAVEMYVKKGDYNNIHHIEITKCKYIKTVRAYYFYITIEAIEERKHCVYDAKVDFMLEDHSRRLSHFKLTDRKPHKPPAEEGIMLKPKTHPDSWLDGASREQSGMLRRPKGSICKGYDFQTPWDIGIP